MAKQNSGPVWENRIVGYTVKPASEFLAHPDNWRRHPKAQQEAVRGSLAELGWIDVVLENIRTGHLLDGHERIFEALAMGDETPVPCIQVDISEEEESLALLVIDPIASMAQSDKDQLDALLREVQTSDEGIRAMLADLAAKEGITPPDFQPVGIDEQERLDQKSQVTCPECGHTFTPRMI